MSDTLQAETPTNRADAVADVLTILGEITTLTWRTESRWHEGLSAEDRIRVLAKAREAIAMLDGRLSKRIGQAQP